MVPTAVVHNTVYHMYAIKLTTLFSTMQRTRYTVTVNESSDQKYIVRATGTYLYTIHIYILCRSK